MTTIALDARKVADFGIGTYLRGLIGALPPLLDREELVLLGDPSAAARLDEPLPTLRWIEERSPLYSLRELWSVPRAARRGGAQLLHVPHYTRPVGSKLPVVVTIHDTIHLRYPRRGSALRTAYARWMIRRALDADAVLTVSESTRNDLRDRFGPTADRVVVVPNGVDDHFFVEPPAEEVRRAVEAWGLQPGYLLFVGNPLPHKNLTTLLEAVKRLRSDPATRVEVPTLVIAGSRGSAIETVRSLVGQAGLDGAVRVVPHLAASKLPALYAGASLVVVPSLWEGFGLPAAEAMACGVPVLASERGGLPEVVGEAAELIDPTSAGSIAERLGALLRDPVRRAELSSRGRERARRFRWPETARRTLEVYRSLYPKGSRE